GSSHFLLEFSARPSHQQIRELRSRGFRITSFVAATSLVVAGPDEASWDGLGLNYIGRLDELDKVSEELVRRNDGNFVIVDFHPDVDMDDAGKWVREASLRVHERQGLLPTQLLVGGELGRIERLAAWDEVAYI